jgi:pyrimidine-nucleoside phosphorylase
MRAYDIILKKRYGQELATEEINFMVEGFVKGTVPDYQVSAWAMTICFQGMNARETADLTVSMARSGDMADLSDIKGIKVDKHSTGGVGDTTTLVLAPLVAACGAPVAKMSGRGLGHTGGTLDKLESIPGFGVEKEPRDFVDQVNRLGVAVIGQTGNLVPADKKLYALRDVTGTVDNIPLIASSIMSKKIAGGAEAIVLDVKTGNGAFMRELEDSFDLARAMVDIGTELGRETVAVVTDMEQPLGLAVGNALEVREAIDTLRGSGPADLEELCLVLGAHMLRLAGKAASFEEGRAQLEAAISNGSGLAKLKEMVAAQGGDPGAIDDPSRLPTAARQVEVVAPQDGYVHAIEALDVGLAASLLGAGRETKDSAIDLAVGIVLRKKVGDAVRAGETLAVLHVNREDRLVEARDRLLAAFEIGSERPTVRPLIFGVVTKEGIQRLA